VKVLRLPTSITGIANFSDRVIHVDVRFALRVSVAIALIATYILATNTDTPEPYPEDAVASALSVSVPNSGQNNWLGWTVLSAPTFGFSALPDRIDMKFALGLRPSANTKLLPILTVWVPLSANNLESTGCSTLTRSDYADYSLSALTCTIDGKHLADGPYIVDGGNLSIDFSIALLPYVLREGVGRESEVIGMSRYPNVDKVQDYLPFAELVDNQKLELEGNRGFYPNTAQRFTFVPRTTSEMTLVRISIRGLSRIEYSNPPANFYSDTTSFWEMPTDASDFVADIHLIDDGARKKYDLFLFALALMLGILLGPAASGAIAWRSTKGP